MDMADDRGLPDDDEFLPKDYANYTVQPPKQQESQICAAILRESTFKELCSYIKDWLLSPENDRVYPEFMTHKWSKQNFRKRCSMFKWDEERQKLFRKWNQPKVGCKYLRNVKYIDTK